MPGGSAKEASQTLQADPSEQHADRGNGSRADSRDEKEPSSGSQGSNQSADSKVDIAAVGEQAADTEEGAAKDKSEKLPYDLPTGKFWLHDDRTDEDANNRQGPPHPHSTLAFENLCFADENKSKLGGLHIMCEECSLLHTNLLIG